MVVFATVLVGASITASYASANDIIRWGSSVVGAGSQATIAAMASVITANTDLTVLEQVTGGPAENMRLLPRGEIDVGQLSSDVAYHGYRGEANYASQGKSDLMGLFTLYPAGLTFMTAKNSGLTHIDQLKGKRIAVGPAGSAGPRIVEAWLKAYGIAEGSDLVAIGYSEGADALRSGTVDAAFIVTTGKGPAGFTNKLDLSMDAVPVEWSFDGPGYANLQKNSPEFDVTATIEKGWLKHLDRDIRVPATYSAEYATGRLSEDSAYRLVKAVWELREEIKRHVANAKWYAADPARLLQGLAPAVPVHPGAVRFYKEIGVWDPEVYTVGVIRE
ncbi:MAG: hypothetical protein TEF_18905 [Rhizobiales bacterium NRL2]|jgi:hypothetical protein|nr:MAG: hypothetical protein TEF_18905 [Rhizobiales bacterium NRL2]